MQNLVTSTPYHPIEDTYDIENPKIEISIENGNPTYQGQDLQHYTNLKKTITRLQHRTITNKIFNNIINPAACGLLFGVIIDVIELLILRSYSRVITIIEGLSILAWPTTFALLFIIGNQIYKCYKGRGERITPKETKKIMKNLETIIHLLETQQKLKIS